MSFYSRFVFGPVMDWSLRRPMINDLRARLIGQAAGSVLEIGFGTGLNLPFYRPEVSRLTLLDSEVLLPGRVERRLAGCAAGQIERILARAEHIPMGDASCDCIVSTFTLCSIADVAAALAEVRRVLAPGGRFLFLEHGQSPSASVARWQDRLNATQRFWAQGCHLNRPIDRLVGDSGLVVNRLERPVLPGVPAVLRELYLGSAG